MFRLVLLLVYCIACPAVGAPPRGEVALWAGWADADASLVEQAAEAPLNPASTMKLVTSFAALDTLGPNWRWRTELKSAAPQVGDTLAGDVAWVGRGDPSFDLAALDALQAQLWLRGIREIGGRLLLDKQAFSSVGSADDFTADADRVFAIAPDTHLTQLKVGWLHFFHDALGPRVALAPALAGVTLVQSLQDDPHAEGACGDVRRRVHIVLTPAQVRVSGRLPASCDGARSFVNLLSANDYATQAFAARWHRLGGRGPQGSAVAASPASARTLATHESPPLAHVLAAINQYSNNTMARSVFLTLGSERPQLGDTVADAVATVRASLAAHRLHADSLVLENGAGLSRRERISARELGLMLRAAVRAPFGPELIASLPAAGLNGTLKQRLAHWGPRLRLKTGTLASVAALAGYWLDPNGRVLVVVALDNDAQDGSQRVDLAVDALLRRYTQLAPGG